MCMCVDKQKREQDTVGRTVGEGRRLGNTSRAVKAFMRGSRRWNGNRRKRNKNDGAGRSQGQGID